MSIVFWPLFTPNYTYSLLCYSIKHILLFSVSGYLSPAFRKTHFLIQFLFRYTIMFLKIFINQGFKFLYKLFINSLYHWSFNIYLNAITTENKSFFPFTYCEPFCAIFSFLCIGKSGILSAVLYVNSLSPWAQTFLNLTSTASMETICFSLTHW